MYTARISNKTTENGIFTIYVEFTNGTNTVTEWCRPQNEDGFKHWVKSRLEAFNASETLDTAYSANDIVDVTDPIVTPPTPTQAEIDRDAWLVDYRRWVKVKSTLIDTGILTGNEAQVTTLRNRVSTNFKPEYLNLL